MKRAADICYEGVKGADSSLNGFVVAAFSLAMGWGAFYNNIGKPRLVRWAFAVGTPLVFWLMVAGFFGMIHTFGPGT